MRNHYRDLIAGRRSIHETAIDEKNWLISQLTHRKSRVRWNAACLLGRFQYNEGVNALIIALQDEHWLVRLHAAKALGRIRDRQAIKPLQEHLQDSCPYVQRQVRLALGYIGTENIVFHSANQERVRQEKHPIVLKRQLPPAFDINKNEINNIKKASARFAIGIGLLFFFFYVAFELDKFGVIVYSLIPIALIWDSLRAIVDNGLCYSKKRAWIKNAVRVQVPIVNRIIEYDDYAETREAYSNCELAVKHSCPTVNSTHDQVIWAKVSDHIYHKYKSQDFVYILYDSQNPYSFIIEDE